MGTSGVLPSVWQPWRQRRGSRATMSVRVRQCDASPAPVCHTPRSRTRASGAGQPCPTPGPSVWFAIMVWALAIVCASQVIHVAAAGVGTRSAGSSGDASGSATATPVAGAAGAGSRASGPGTRAGRGSSKSAGGGDASARVVAPRNKWRVPTPPHHILFASLALRGHTSPLLRLAREMAARGYRVSFATNTRGADWVNSTGAQVRTTRARAGAAALDSAIFVRARARARGCLGAASLCQRATCHCRLQNCSGCWRTSQRFVAQARRWC